jgi:hypothetical protein
VFQILVSWHAGIFTFIKTSGPSGGTVWGAYGLGPLEHWDRGLESHSRHGRRISAFLCFVLFVIGRCLEMGRSPVQEDLQKCIKVLIMNRNRPKGLIHETLASSHRITRCNNPENLEFHLLCLENRVGLAQWYSSGLRTGWSGLRTPGVVGNFSLHHRVQTGSGSHPASYPSGRAVKLTTHLHLVPRSKNAWSYTATPPIRLYGIVLS